MCGFAGIVAWADRFRTDRETLRKMSARIAHRGPDGEGIWLNHEQEVTADRPQCGLAFRRLAILDPDPRAMQPFTIGRKTLVFNGEIYNFRELRAELTQVRPDYEWRTTGDTEVLLLAYDVWAEKCVERLNGMFALAVWDEDAKSLFLARDRMGQKPLYVTPVAYLDEGTHNHSLAGVAFGSEIPALLSVSWVGRDVLSFGLVDYLQWGYSMGCGTIYEQIGQMSPGQLARLAHSSQEVRRYFTADPSADPHWRTNGGARLSTDEAAVDRVRGLTLQAVRRQLVSDVPVGCFLSGGIDSSIVAAAMRHAVASESDHPPQTFSIGFDDPRYDESAYAAEVAQHLGTRHHAFTVRPDAAADLPAVAAAFGEPFGDSSALPTYYLARETRPHVKVALSGDGGDELFGGYDRYRAMALARRLRRLAPIMPWGLLELVLPARIGRHPKTRGARVRRFVRSLSVPDARRYAQLMHLDGNDRVSVFDRKKVRSAGMLVPSYLGADDDVADAFQARYRQYGDVVRTALAVDRALYLPNDLLTKVDRCSMAFALEVRSPFMDHELVQFAAGLTTDQLLKGGPKRMLREAFADDLPAWVFKRRKMGFAVPIGDWFRGELRPMLRDHLFAADSFARQHFQMGVVQRLVDEHESQRQDHSQRLYALLMLELWWRTCR